MRTIKFRVWDKKEKTEKMIYLTQEFLKERQGNLQDFLYSPDRFIPMEFTGLKDKNGKDIFESDVLKVILPSGESYIGQVDFSYGQFWCVRHNGYGGEGYDFDFLCNKDRYVKQAELEVIGNIYENDIIKLNKENL